MPVETSPPSPGGNLVPGRAVPRAVWKGDSLFFFEGRAGEVVTLRVTSRAPGLDPHVVLLDPEAQKEASDDDSGGHGNSLLKDHTLMKSGRYAVKVGLAWRERGEIEVLLIKQAKATKPGR